MKLTFPDRTINVFSVIYREEGIQEYDYNDIMDFIRTSADFDFTGLLLFESNRGNVEPWVLGQEVLSKTDQLVPFIAVNPVYMHPFLVAKKILTLSKIYKRRVFLNFITGTSKNDLENLNDILNHDEKYLRLIEFVQIIDHLLRNNSVLNFSGRYYTVKNLKLSSILEEDLIPSYFIAGSSEAAKNALMILKGNAACMGHIVDEWQSISLKEINKKAVHFGVVCRRDSSDAKNWVENWTKDTSDPELFNYSMKNTNGEWKKRLGSMPENYVGSCYSLTPFNSFKSDCPYYVGDYQEISEIIIKYIVNGYETLIIETPNYKEDFRHLTHVFEMADKRVRQQFYNLDYSIDFNF